MDARETLEKYCSEREMFEVMSVWKPPYKYNLVEWLHKACGYSKSSLNRKRKKELYGIYYRIRREMGR